MSIDYASRIPNNVDLDSNKTLQRALEHWQPRYLDWWREMGPEDTGKHEIYLRTAVSVEAGGWAQFGYVRMPEYRWGIFLAPPEQSRTVGFGQARGSPVWSEVPGEHRANLRRLIVTQADTEPASVEQQKQLGRSAPSLYDLRNLYQVNVEEGRHLWAMVYLLHAYFGRDGREEGEALLERRAGDPDKPRILSAFNEKTSDWLSFFFFTFLTDRDGKFQLAALAESGFDPLARTTRFMLTEEAHHLFVGENGITRVVQRTAEIMRQQGTDDPTAVRKAGAIDLPTLQRYLNFHFSVTLDLYGSEISTNAANFYTLGLKGRFEESKLGDDHLLQGATYAVPEFSSGRLVETQANALDSLNERLRDDYITDVQAAMVRINRVLERAELSCRLKLPHKGFHREIGNFAGAFISPEGEVLDRAAFEARKAAWLPSPEDFAFVASLMGPVYEPGKMAGWIAPPPKGIDSKPLDFEYVRFA